MATLECKKRRRQPRALGVTPHAGTEVLSLAVLEAGRLASGSAGGTITVWDLPTESRAATLAGHQGQVRSLVVLEGGRLASGSWAKLKGSIGEGSNHTNFSHQSSVKIQSE